MLKRVKGLDKEFTSRVNERFGDAFKLFNSSLGIISSAKQELRSIVQTKVAHHLTNLSENNDEEIDELKALLESQAKRIAKLEASLASKTNNKSKKAVSK